MRNPLNALLLLLVVNNAVANTNDDIRLYQREGEAQTALVSKNDIASLNAASTGTVADNQALIEQLFSKARATLPKQNSVKEAAGAILFVSFSMPDSLLFAMADEAARFHIPLVINGLVEGDFKKTIATFSRLNAEANKQKLNFQGVSIDPVWFQQFQINSVPALVVSKATSCVAGTVCSNQSFDVVYGNARIKKSLELIASRGKAAPELAKQILEQGHV